VLVGSGERALEDRFRWLAEAFSDHLSLFIGFDEGRAHRVFAGSDAFLMPSRFEPCGLGQMAAMRYGTVPLVHAVGGLRDTVIDAERGVDNGANGFAFEGLGVGALEGCLTRAAQCFHEDADTWSVLVERGMREDWSWAPSAREYLALYEELGGRA
jgi:starch synthase